VLLFLFERLLALFLFARKMIASYSLLYNPLLGRADYFLDKKTSSTLLAINFYLKNI
jgi:hypothetical protein